MKSMVNPMGVYASPSCCLLSHDGNIPDRNGVSERNGCPAMNLMDLILQSIDSAIVQQRADGSFPGGHNGPYRDVETPVRNTAHWLFAIARAYRLTGINRYHVAGEAALGYLFSTAARPMGATFFCRRNPNKDFSNGLIGQAWVVEALLEAAVAFDHSEAVDLAFSTISLHPFDQKRRLWLRVNVDGSWSGIDNTFNHQLWFASAVALVLELHSSPAINEDLERFLGWVGGGGLRVSNAGRIIHHIPHPSTTVRSLRCVNRTLSPLRSMQEIKRLRHKEIGYHAFNMYAFGILRSVRNDLGLWGSAQFQKALRFLLSRQYESGLRCNKYGYPYNPAGFEAAYTLSQFPGLLGAKTDEHVRRFVERQFEFGWDRDTRMLTKNRDDRLTAAARLYEVVRLPKLDFQLFNI